MRMISLLRGIERLEREQIALAADENRLFVAQVSITFSHGNMEGLEREGRLRASWISTRPFALLPRLSGSER